MLMEKKGYSEGFNVSLEDFFIPKELRLNVEILPCFSIRWVSKIFSIFSSFPMPPRFLYNMFATIQTLQPRCQWEVSNCLPGNSFATACIFFFPS
ncbi:hypothetical protein LguiB_018275 [Lonicera macranthoides]